jgi:hypothetical protein
MVRPGEDRGPHDTHPTGWRFVAMALGHGLAFIAIAATCGVLACFVRKPKEGEDYKLNRALRDCGLQ